MPSPEQPSELPPEMVEFLKDRRFACVTQATNLGTALVIKAPRHEIASLRGRVPIQLRQELHDHPMAPVIRMVLTIYDQPKRPLALETFINVADPSQRSDFAALAEQEELNLLFYDEDIRHRLSKRIRFGSRDTVESILRQADHLVTAIPTELFDFDRAKAAVMRRTKL